MKTVIKSILKKILKIFIISSLIFFVAYSLLIASGYIFHNIFNINIGETTDVFTYSFSEFISIIFILILPVSVLYGFVFTLILLPFILFEKRMANKWFIIGYAIYFFVGFLIFKDWHTTWFYQLCYFFIPLVTAVIVIKKVKWFM